MAVVINAKHDIKGHPPVIKLVCCVTPITSRAQLKCDDVREIRLEVCLSAPYTLHFSAAYLVEILCLCFNTVMSSGLSTFAFSVILIQSRPATTRPVIRRIGCNAVGRASRFFCRQGEYVEIMVNNVTVILVVRDTCKINTTSTSTVPRTVPGNVRSR